jgi:hypothetical protein
LDHVAVELQVEPRQPAKLGALSFTLALKNNTKQALRVHNPYDLVTYILTNAEGWPISLPAPASRLKILRQGPFINRKTAYLAVTGINRAGVRQDIDEEIAREVITIEAGSTYAYDLRIDKVAAPAGPTGPATLTAGDYGLAFILPLLLAGKSTEFSRTLGTDTIPVTLSD